MEDFLGQFVTRDPRKKDELVQDDFLGQFIPPTPKPKTGLISDIKRGTGQIISSVGSTLRDIGAEDVGQAVEEYGTGITQRYPSQISSFSDVLERPGTTIREAVGEMVPQVGTALAGGLGGRAIGGGLGFLVGGPVGAAIGQNIGGAVGSLLPIGVQEYGGIRQTQREAGIDDRTRALLTAIPATALERLGAEQLVGKFVTKGAAGVAREAGEAGLSLPRYMAKEGLKSGLIEGPLTEVPQTVLERYGAYQPLTTPEAFSEYGVAGAKGFAGGGVIGGALAGLRPVERAPVPGSAPTIEPGAETPTNLLARQGELFTEGEAPRPEMSPLLREQVSFLADRRDALEQQILAQAKLAEASPERVDPLAFREMVDQVNQLNQYLRQTTSDQGDFFNDKRFTYTEGLQGRKERTPRRTKFQREFFEPEIPAEAPQELILPQSTAREDITLAKVPTTQELYATASVKAARGELLSPLERDVLANPPSTQPLDLLTRTARAPQPTQLDMFGTPLDQRSALPSPAEPRTIGAQPGQQEMFYPSGAPTYGAAEPDVTRLATNRLQLEGAKPTQKRLDIAVQAENALAENRIDQDTYDQIYTLLRESKYGRAQKLVEAPVAAPVAAPTAPLVEQPIPEAPAVAQPAVAAPVAAPEAPAAETAAPVVETPVAAPEAPAAETATPTAEKEGTLLQRRTKFGKAISAVVQVGGNFLKGRKNAKMAKAVRAEDKEGMLSAMSESKSPVVRWIADKAKGLDFKVRVDDTALEEYDREAALQSENAEITIRILDAMRAGRDLIEKSGGFSKANLQDIEVFPKGFTEFGAPVSLSSYAFNNKLFNKDAYLKHLAEMEQQIGDNEANLRRAANRMFRAIGVEGTYDRKNKVVTTTDYGADNESVVAHEVLHALTVDAIENPSPRQRITVAKLRTLYQTVKDKEDLKGTYGVTSVEEFVAEGLSNPDFQQKLSEIPYERTTAWGTFTKYVAELIGIKYDNAFIELIALTEELTAGEQNAVQVKGAAEVPVQPRAEAAKKFPDVRSITNAKVGPGAPIKPKVIAENKPLYRETNVEGLNDILRFDTQGDISFLFVTDNKDIAIGQGDNTGVTITFRPNSLSGTENKKPMTGDLAGREYKTDLIAPRAIQSVVMRKSAVKSLPWVTRHALQAFDQQDIGNGLVEFTRTGLPVIGEQNAVQVQGAAEVPVQPRAEVSERVGEEVRGAEKPAAEGKQAQAVQAEKVELPKGVLTTKQAVDQLVANGVSEGSALNIVKNVSTGYGTVRAIDLRRFLIAGISAKQSGQKPVYSKGEKAAAKGSTTKQVSDWIAPTLDKWKNAPKVNVVQKASDLPAEVNPTPNAKGLFYKGEVYIVADNATSKLDTMVTLFHEVVGHYGFRALAPENTSEYIRILTQLASQNEGIRNAAKLWRERSPGTIQDLKENFGYTDTMIRAVSIEEAMADEAYNALQYPAVREALAKSPALKAFVRWIAKSLRALGMTDIANKVQGLTNNLDVFALLTMAQNAVQRGGRQIDTAEFRRWFGDSKVVDEQGRPLVVYHGTGADIYEFSKDKLGTYTGALSAKMGFFFVNNPEVADYYAKNSGRTGGANVLPVYLSMQNPLVVDMKRRVYRETTYKDIIQKAVEEGRDGVIIRNTYDAGESIQNLPMIVPGWDNLNEKVYGLMNKPSDIYVVFEPTQIKSAIGNIGTFDPKNPDIRFRTGEEQPVATTAQNIPMFSDGGPLPPSQAPEGIKAFDSAINPMQYSGFRRTLLGTRFFSDIVDSFGARLSGLKDYKRVLDRMEASTNELLRQSDKIVTKWTALGDEADALSKVAGVATASDIHPDIPLDANKHDSNGRSLTNAHKLGENGAISEETQKQYDELRQLWNSLSPKAKAVYFEARDFMHKTWMRRQDAYNKTVNEMFQPLIDAANKVGNTEKVKDLEKARRAQINEFGKVLAQVKGPYFPLMRFGKYFVSYKSEAYRAAEAELDAANTELSELATKFTLPTTTRKQLEDAQQKLVEMGEDPKVLGLSPEVQKAFTDAKRKVREAQKKIAKLTQEGDKHFVNEGFESQQAAELRAAELDTEVRLAEEFFRELSPVNKGFINRLSDAVGGVLTGEQANAAREAMTQIYLANLPQTSALKNELKRKGVAGWSTDMLRAFATGTRKDAHYLSRLENMDDMTAELLRMRKAKNAQRSLQTDEVYNEVARRHVASLAYHQSPIEDAMTAAAFVYQLGVSPAYLMTNMTQPWMISMPFMASKHGYIATATELAKGFATSVDIAKTSYKDQGMSFSFDLDKFPAGEKAMLEDAMKSGLLDITLEMNLSEVARGGQGLKSKIMRALGVLPHQAEVINRVMTALAAYRLEKKAGASQENAVEYAKSVLDKTHINYSTANSPYYLKPGVVPFGKVIFQYRKYQLGMLTLLAKNWAKAMKSADPKERAEAKRILFGVFATHGLVTGMLGLPGIGTALFIADLINSMFGDDDEPFDAEAELRTYLAEIFGAETGLVVAKGLPTMLGIDLSRTIGMGNIAAPVRILRQDKEGRDLYSEFLMSALGPTIGGLGPQMAEGISSLANGDLYRGAEGLTPRFIRDVIRAVRMSEEGVTTRSGQQVMQPEEISEWTKVYQALGIPTTFVTERQAAVAAVEGANKTLADRRAALTKEYVKSRMENDTAAMAEVREKIDKYNEKRRAKGEPLIMQKDLINAYKQRTEYTKNVNEQGVSLPKKQKALGEYGAFAQVRSED